LRLGQPKFIGGSVELDRSSRTREGAASAWRRWAALALMGMALPAMAEVVPTASFTGPPSYTPGSPTSSTYTLVLGNTGTTTESSASVNTNFPAGATVSWSCGGATGGATCPSGGAGSGTGNLSNKDPGSLPQNGT